MKKTLGILLSLVLLISMLPMPWVSAETAAAQPIFSDDYLTRVPIGTTAASLKSMLVSEATFAVYTADGTVVEDTQTVATGMQLVVIGQEVEYARYTLAVIGDLTGSGTLTTTDARVILHSFVSGEALDELEKHAADYNGDGAVDTADARDVVHAVLSEMSSQPTAVSHFTDYVDLAVGVSTKLPYNETLTITNSAEWSDFFTAENPVFYYRMSHRYGSQLWSLFSGVLVPIVGADEYVKSITADDTTVYITMNCLDTPFIGRTAYAIVWLPKSALAGKTVRVTREAELGIYKEFAAPAVVMGTAQSATTTFDPFGTIVFDNIYQLQSFANGGLLTSMDELAVYDEAFFEENVLVMNYFPFTSSDNAIAPTYAAIGEDVIVLAYEYLYRGMGYAAFTYQYCFSELSRSDYHGQEFAVSIATRYHSDYEQIKDAL